MLPINNQDLSGIKISFIVKTYNEEKKVGACIESILKATTRIRNPFEIIIADAVSSDKTVEIAARYPVKIVQFTNPADRGCGAGVQLGYQHACGGLVFLLDGDMTLQPEFLPAALEALSQDALLGGVAGLMTEVAIRNTFDEMRVRSGATATVSVVRWLNGGGLYRRAAIEAAGGYAANQNLKGWEEAELGMRLHSAGWKLKRIGVPATAHDGHRIDTWPLIRRHWQSRRLMANGVLIRSAIGHRWLPQASILLIHPGCVLIFWLLALPLTISVDLGRGTHLTYLLFALVCAICFRLILKKRTLSEALQSVAIWHVNAAGLIWGLFSPITPPKCVIPGAVIYDASFTDRGE